MMEGKLDFESGLRTELLRAIETHSAKSGRSGSGSTLKIAVVAVAALGISFGLAFGLWRSLSSGQSHAGTAAQLGSFTLGQDPLALGVASTISAAPSQVGYTLLLPNHTLASSSNLSNVWVETSSGSAALYYGSSEIEILYWTAPSGVQQDYNSMAKGMAAQQATVGSVQGVPALVIPENTTGATGTGTQNNPGSVTFTLNGVVMGVIGYYSTDTLTKVANSMAAPATT